ncbi:MAG: spore cortex biosynthesis protein YabQ [Lachnospiraceae bacterium]|nr:spore cortex biosynthesis protein YabQ [Lachnospiraceae bacterium]
MSGVIRRETVVFLLSVLHGTALTLFYDFLRALRRSFRHSLPVLSAEDFLFWMLAGVLTFCLAFRETDGVIRNYVAAGILIGFLLYHFTVSPIVVKGLSRLFSLLYRVCSCPFRGISTAVGKIFEIFCKIIKKRIEFTRKKVYNIRTILKGRLRRGRSKEGTKARREKTCIENIKRGK